MVLCYLCNCEIEDSFGEFSCSNHEETRHFCGELHFSYHKHDTDTCLPWSIFSSPQYGRYLVASRDIQPGELILKEDCICWGPNHELEECVCVECLNLIPDYEQEKVRWCENCKLPLCLNHCQSHPTHDIECKIVASYRSKENCDNDDFTSWYSIIEIIRCQHLLKSRKDIKSLLSNLMDHNSERISQPDVYIEPYKETLKKAVDGLQIGTKEEILQIIGYFDVNSIAVRGRDGPYRGRGLYPVASLMNHSCICNTRNIITGINLECRACVTIPAGAPITTHYVSPLLDVGTRRSRLREKWFFECNCFRCYDPSENGSYTSGMKCQLCDDGYCLPDVENGWFHCDKCGNSVPEFQAQMMIKMWDPIVQAMGSFESAGIEEKLNLIKQLENTFHPNHSMILELKLSIVNKMCKDKKGVLCTNLEDLDTKIELCVSLLNVLDVVYPGRSKYRGLVLHEIAETALTRAGILCNDNKIDQVEFNAKLKQILEYLDDGEKCLEHDRKNSMENEVYKNMQKTKETCKDFLNFSEFL